MLITGAITMWAVVAASRASEMLFPWPDVLFATDFFAFWTAARMVLAGSGAATLDLDTQCALQTTLRFQLATDETLRSFPICIPFYNPPPIALLMAPLGALPIGGAYALWSALSISLLILSVGLPARLSIGRRPATWLVLAFAGGAAVVLKGQVDSVFVVALSAGLVALGAGRPVVGGALLGILWLKPQYAALFALVLLVKRRWRELSGLLATGIAMGGLSLAMVGWEGLTAYIEVLQRIGAFQADSLRAINPHLMVNWRAAILNVWPSVSREAGMALMAALGSGTVILALAAWTGPWEPSTPRFARQMTVVTIAVILGGPHSYFHSTALLMAPLALWAARPMSGKPESKAALLMMAVGFVLSLLAWQYRWMSWLMAIYLAGAMAILTLQCRNWPKGATRL